MNRDMSIAKLINFTLLGIMILALTGGILTGCTKVESTPTPTPTLSFQEQRTRVVQFLKQINGARNNFDDASKSANIDRKISSGNVLELNAALTTVMQQLEGYQRQVSDISIPSGISELAELKAANLAAAAKIYQAFQQVRSAIQSGNAAEVQRAVQFMRQLSSDPDYNRSDEIEKTLLARYNIPDPEVNYRRR